MSKNWEEVFEEMILEWDSRIEELTEATRKLSVSDRRKIGRKMHRGAAGKKAQRTKKRNERKTLKPEQIQAKAKKWARLELKKKLMKELPKDATVADKIRVEKRLDSPQYKLRLERLEKRRFRALRKVGGHGSKLVDKSKGKEETKGKESKEDGKSKADQIVQAVKSKADKA
jgi:hypothetical protein